jgi:hypothetical protein
MYSIYIASFLLDFLILKGAFSLSRCDVIYVVSCLGRQSAPQSVKKLEPRGSLVTTKLSESRRIVSVSIQRLNL